MLKRNEDFESAVGYSNVPAIECKERTAPEESGRSTQPITVEQVIRDYGASVYSVARSMLGNDSDADDVSQDVLLQVVRKLDTFRGESSLFTWLYRITFNAVLALRRKRSMRRECQVKQGLDHCVEENFRAGPIRPWSAPADKQLLSREARDLIEDAIARLPRIYRDVYILGDVDERANGDIGRLLGLSLPAVKSRLHRARLMLREVLASYFEKA